MAQVFCSVEVPSTLEVPDPNEPGKTFITFNITLTHLASNRSQTCTRRFHEFREFDRVWAQLYPTISERIKLPSKFTPIQTKSVIDKRRVKLQEYLVALVEIKAIQPLVAQFLGVPEDYICAPRGRKQEDLPDLAIEKWRGMEDARDVIHGLGREQQKASDTQSHGLVSVEKDGETFFIPGQSVKKQFTVDEMTVKGNQKRGNTHDANLRAKKEKEEFLKKNAGIIASLMPGRQLNVAYNVDRTGQSNERYMGRLHISLWFRPGTGGKTRPTVQDGFEDVGGGCLVIEVHSGMDLPSYDGITNPYCKIYLLPDPQKISKRKTASKSRTVNPTWEQVIEYNGIYPAELIYHRLIVSVWDRRTTGKNHCVGEVTVMDMINLPTTPQTKLNRWIELSPWSNLAMDDSAALSVNTMASFTATETITRSGPGMGPPTPRPVMPSKPPPKIKVTGGSTPASPMPSLPEPAVVSPQPTAPIVPAQAPFGLVLPQRPVAPATASSPPQPTESLPPSTPVPSSPAPALPPQPKPFGAAAAFSLPPPRPTPESATPAPSLPPTAPSLPPTAPSLPPTAPSLPPAAPKPQTALVATLPPRPTSSVSTLPPRPALLQQQSQTAAAPPERPSGGPGGANLQAMLAARKEEMDSQRSNKLPPKPAAPATPGPKPFGAQSTPAASPTPPRPNPVSAGQPAMGGGGGGSLADAIAARRAKMDGTAAPTPTPAPSSAPTPSSPPKPPGPPSLPGAGPPKPNAFAALPTPTPAPGPAIPPAAPKPFVSPTPPTAPKPLIAPTPPAAPKPMTTPTPPAAPQPTVPPVAPKPNFAAAGAFAKPTIPSAPSTTSSPSSPPVPRRAAPNPVSPNVSLAQETHAPVMTTPASPTPPPAPAVFTPSVVAESRVQTPPLAIPAENRYIVILEYTPTPADVTANQLLPLKVGELVNAVDRSDTVGWWYGIVGTKEGYFPGTYVKPA